MSATREYKLNSIFRKCITLSGMHYSVESVSISAYKYPRTTIDNKICNRNGLKQYPIEISIHTMSKAHIYSQYIDINFDSRNVTINLLTLLSIIAWSITQTCSLWCADKLSTLFHRCHIQPVQQNNPSKYRDIFVDNSRHSRTWKSLTTESKNTPYGATIDKRQ